ncbi:MAG: T9SS type A sorting domain-containing protein [Candidatus Cloacimonetes bacterium]|jgi:hypothetical protein|nr:T9SS type A sorting domain-containing protein [Candidatus Cloacimonadota bacterium]
MKDPKKKFYPLCRLIIILMLFGISILFAQNNMPLFCTMYGEFNGAALGHTMASLDFNGDGIHDLVALEKHWNPDGVFNLNTGQFGRINFYWGGEEFDANLDAAICGSYSGEYGLGQLTNMGDINNDGKEDLCYCGKDQNWAPRLCIFYGRDEPVSVPDYVLSYPYSEVSSLNAQPVGDINNDGYNDVAITATRSNGASSWILDGATMTIFEVGSSSILRGFNFMTGIGDVNNDGIDDYLRITATQPKDYDHNRITVHFGGNSIPSGDSLLITDDTNMLINPIVGPLGDLDGDGISDFVAWIGGGYYRIWYGSSNLSAQWDLLIPNLSYNSGLIHGDFNADGYSDIIASNYYYDDDGAAWLWLGGENMNGTYDFKFPTPHSISEKFGQAKAAGDFNNDGFCDVAISQPYSDPAPLWTPGRIHVFLGNADLTDTTVSNEDDVLPPHTESSKWEIQLFPNPISGDRASLNIKFLGQGYKELKSAKMEIFNIKGQKISSYIADQASLTEGSYTGQIPDLVPGLYFLKVSDQAQGIRTHKFIVK